MSRRKQHQGVFFLTLLYGGALLFVASFFFVDSASAQIPNSIIPQCNWYGDPGTGANKETYGLGAFILLAANVMKFIWGIAGSLALLMFVWGGFQWLTAAGEESRVKAGWDTFMNATIGIGIIFGSWVIINTVILFLVSPGTFSAAQLFGRADWVTIATKDNTVCIKSAQLVKGSVPAAPVTPTTRTSPTEQVACCYKKTSMQKMATSLGVIECKAETKKLFDRGEILGTPLFECKYSGPSISNQELCWGEDSATHVPTYCKTKEDWLFAGGATPTIPNISGICCISDRTGVGANSVYSEVSTLDSCKSYQGNWLYRGSVAQKGIFQLVFCAKETNASVCGTNSGNDWRGISCSKKVDLDPTQDAADIQRQIDDANR